jgi:hypothetical protein
MTPLFFGSWWSVTFAFSGRFHACRHSPAEFGAAAAFLTAWSTQHVMRGVLLTGLGAKIAYLSAQPTDLIR